MIDEQMLTDAFRKASAAEAVRVPPLTRIVARAEYAKEKERRRRFTTLIALAPALAVVCPGIAILVASPAFPLSLSPGIMPLLVISAVAMFWVIGETEDVDVSGIGPTPIRRS